MPDKLDIAETECNGKQHKRNDCDCHELKIDVTVCVQNRIYIYQIAVLPVAQNVVYGIQDIHGQKENNTAPCDHWISKFTFPFFLSERYAESDNQHNHNGIDQHVKHPQSVETVE